MPSTFDIDNSTHAADPIFSSSTASSAQHSPLRIKLVDMVVVSGAEQLRARLSRALARETDLFRLPRRALQRWWSSPLKGCPPSLPSGRTLSATPESLPTSQRSKSGRVHQWPAWTARLPPVPWSPRHHRSAALPTCMSSRSFASSVSTMPQGILLPPAASARCISANLVQPDSAILGFWGHEHIYILGFGVMIIYI